MEEPKDEEKNGKQNEQSFLKFRLNQAIKALAEY